jgi:hypothetical protein
VTEPSYDANDLLFGSGIPPAAFTSPGDTYAGKITKLDAVQQRKFDKGKPTNELDYWPDGSKKMMAVITLATDHRDAEDASDDGQRKIYAASKDMQRKIREAVKSAGRKGLDLGGWLRVTYVREEKQDSGLYAKIYEVEYRAPGAADAQQALGLVDQPEAKAQVPNLADMLGNGGGQLPPDVLAKVQAMYANQQAGA